MLFNLAVLLGTLVAMEGVGTLAHKHVMHGWGWWLHRSHHRPQLGMLEPNDLYLLALALIASGLMLLGRAGHPALQWVGLGVAGYGVLYVVFHDGLFHRHWPRRLLPLNGYLRRLHLAHRLHHRGQVHGKGVSFGFFYAPPLAVLRRHLREQRRAAHAATSVPERRASAERLVR
ncbi:beta-carotene hydroxylase [Pseudomonas entomophila]|uniref:beta-carotene hydroxylase n=1 Tax=Pseudomonas entomophila TaxID=312306 RepID=UPI0015E286DE|nr:beta-carotene hydroxylase [Pseudomonas entomophila]MBA1188183.1 beta-carotene hydroxylase [Pseudomonas entomophila]